MKALEYDKYVDLLDHCETQGQKCVTLHPDFQDNTLSESVLKIHIVAILMKTSHLTTKIWNGYTNCID